MYPYNAYNTTTTAVSNRGGLSFTSTHNSRHARRASALAADVDLSQNSHPKLVDLEHNGMVQTQEQSTMRVLLYPFHTLNKSATTVNYHSETCLQLNTPINACKGGSASDLVAMDQTTCGVLLKNNGMRQTLLNTLRLLIYPFQAPTKYETFVSSHRGGLVHITHHSKPTRSPSDLTAGVETSIPCRVLVKQNSTKHTSIGPSIECTEIVIVSVQCLQQVYNSCQQQRGAFFHLNTQFKACKKGLISN